ncbi:N-acetylglucosamine-6-phosphate deacetylase [Bacillus suaedaesalsae]|uniref:N-acetylglucosamine-6-phosphate deacetylase n=1 Tax=Bacillus suaedaesalsae TaxID=2810349 RepID=UPI003211B98B
MYSKPVILRNVYIYAEDRDFEDGYIILNNGIIQEIGEMVSLKEEDILDFEDILVPPKCKLLPGMIDIHIHGVAGADTMDASFEAIHTMATSLPKEGTTSFLTTTITQSPAAIENALKNISSYIENQDDRKAEVLGVHLEGPFISAKRAGAQPIEYIQNPNLHTFQNWQRLSNNNIKLVTLAPEINGAIEFTQYLVNHGVIVSLGHSDANYEEVNKAIQAGASHVTHLFNAMSGIHHREPGLTGSALLQDALFIEIIADGKHVHPEMIRLAYMNKTKDKIILITDSIRAKGLKPGLFDLGGQTVAVDETKATLQDGTLAGSILSMEKAVQNFQKYTDCSIRDIIQMTSTNPAKQLNIYNRKGSIAKGKDADVIVMNQNLEVLMTFCRGHLAYAKGY